MIFIEGRRVREREINVCGEFAVGEQFRSKLVIGDYEFMLW
jgi:hypothetical protein